VKVEMAANKDAVIAKSKQEELVGQEGKAQGDLSDPAVEQDTKSQSGKKNRTRQAEKLKMAQFQQLIPEEKKEAVRNIDMLLDVTLPVTVELGHTTLQIKDVLKLGRGSVIELEKSVGEYVDLVVNNKVIAKGEVVVIEENFGFRIVELVPNENSSEVSQ